MRGVKDIVSGCANSQFIGVAYVLSFFCRPAAEPAFEIGILYDRPVFIGTVNMKILIGQGAQMLAVAGVITGRTRQVIVY
jgi:hypothetical protein